MKTATLPPIPTFDIDLDEDSHAAPPRSDTYETQFFDSALQAIKALAPEGSTVCAIGFDDTDIFLRAGYRIVANAADITIVRGGTDEFAKARRTTSRKLIFCPTENYAAAATSVYLDYDKAFGIIKRGAAPHAAVFDVKDTPHNLAAAFGEIASLELCVFDYSFGKMLRGERVTDGISDQAAVIVRDTTKALKNREKDTETATEIIVSAGKAVAMLVMQTPDILYASGAAQTAQALRMLYIAEQRQVCSLGEAEMLLNRYMIDLYIKNLCTKPPLFPPDNNRRAECICKYLGGDIVRTCVYASPILTPDRLRLYEYRCNEFRNEYLRMLAEIRDRQNAAFAVFKRLYPDDGFRLKTMLEPIDIGLCTALAPDVFPTDSLLTFFKHTGKLEKYLI